MKLSGIQRGSLITLTLLVGIAPVVSDQLNLAGWCVLFSNTVMIDFLTGVSITIILSPLGDFTGYSSEFLKKVMKALDTLLYLRQINPQTTAIGLLTVFRS